MFEQDYVLMPLPQLESYLKTNKHLPNIPSAAEVVNEGVSINQITSKLLEKVEEQALYIINLQKQIDELKALMKK
ncbi:MAG: hypothetical protein U5M51_09325 [Emticicia sp.]|nr:hypothetical protein [Emticicia sp.]